MDMSRDWFRDVYDFHKKFRCDIGFKPHEMTEQQASLRTSLIDEEVRETLAAIAQGNLPETADGIVDAIYVLLGTAITAGVDIRPVWRAVHTANMSKVGGGKRDDGKVQKPPGWSPPDVAGIIERQGPLKRESSSL